MMGLLSRRVKRSDTQVLSVSWNLSDLSCIILGDTDDIALKRFAISGISTSRLADALLQEELAPNPQ